VLIAVSRRLRKRAIRESFRTLQSTRLSKPAPVFSFVEVADEEEAPGGNGSTSRIRPWRARFERSARLLALLRPSSAGSGRGRRLIVTDEIPEDLPARPEIAPAPDACPVERRCTLRCSKIHESRSNRGQIAAIADADARELGNDDRGEIIRSACHVEAAYLKIVRHDLKFPRIFIDQLVQVILRNILDDCDDVFRGCAPPSFYSATSD